ncbi:quinon protein alcohol dehydrogenase-like superfamily [Cladochytrium replicatum]|nr:quinon protein alcohol dehydrogenase-like superfamily [Cladochytrium replicatum]
MRLLSSLLDLCNPRELSLLATDLPHRIRRDIISQIPSEIAFKIFQYLDAKSLCHAAQANRRWHKLADDDVVWHRMCRQHIDKKCTTCGWGLPLVDSSPNQHNHNTDLSLDYIASQAAIFSVGPCSASSLNGASSFRDLPPISPADSLSTTASSSASYLQNPRKHSAEEGETIKDFTVDSPHPKRQKLSSPPPCSSPDAATALAVMPVASRRPWKHIYAERLLIARNWRRGRYNVQTLKGHTDGVLCLQQDTRRAVLITGSYDHTVRIWNLNTGACEKVLTGHRGIVNALQFDETKLVTGSSDCTIKIWSLRTFACVRTLEGHASGVRCLNFDERRIATGSAEGHIYIWDFSTAKRNLLRGHGEAVNKIQMYGGQYLFSCSDDSDIRLWDLQSLTTLHTFKGHVAAVMSLQVQFPQRHHHGESSHHGDGKEEADVSTKAEPHNIPESLAGGKLVTGSLDGTLRIWSLTDGTCRKALFGHIDGVYCLSFNTLRLVSGAFDHTVRIWDVESGEPQRVLQGHTNPVNAVEVSDTRIVSADNDGVIRVWDFLNTDGQQ